MEDILDTDEMIKRFKDRAAAVKKRDLPPVGGEERHRFIAQEQTDYLDFAIIGDSLSSCENGFLVLRCDIRSGSSRRGTMTRNVIFILSLSMINILRM